MYTTLSAPGIGRLVPVSRENHEQGSKITLFMVVRRELHDGKSPMFAHSPLTAWRAEISLPLSFSLPLADCFKCLPSHNDGNKGQYFDQCFNFLQVILTSSVYFSCFNIKDEDK